MEKLIGPNDSIIRGLDPNRIDEYLELFPDENRENVMAFIKGKMIIQNHYTKIAAMPQPYRNTVKSPILEYGVLIPTDTGINNKSSFGEVYFNYHGGYSDVNIWGQTYQFNKSGGDGYLSILFCNGIPQNLTLNIEIVLYDLVNYEQDPPGPRPTVTVVAYPFGSFMPKTHVWNYEDLKNSSYLATSFRCKKENSSARLCIKLNWPLENKYGEPYAYMLSGGNLQLSFP